jgi:hypothetical protein
MGQERGGAVSDVGYICCESQGAAGAAERTRSLDSREIRRFSAKYTGQEARTSSSEYTIGTPRNHYVGIRGGVKQYRYAGRSIRPHRQSLLTSYPCASTRLRDTVTGHLPYEWPINNVETSTNYASYQHPTSTDEGNGVLETACAIRSQRFS